MKPPKLNTTPERHLRILKRLLAGEEQDQSQIMTEFKIDRKTVNRMIKTLQKFFPVEYEKRGRRSYYFIKKAGI